MGELSVPPMIVFLFCSVHFILCRVLELSVCDVTASPAKTTDGKTSQVETYRLAG